MIMKNLNQNDKNGKDFSRRKPTVSDLHDFTNEGIHRHIFNVALFLKNWGGEKVSPSEAVDLIKQKFYQGSQRRDLQPREVENAVEKAFNSTGIRVRSSNKVFIPKQVMTSEESLWPKTLQRLATEEASDDAIRDALEQYQWPVSQVIEDSPIKGDAWTALDILGKLYEPDDLICLGTFYIPRTRLLNHWQVEGLVGDLFCPNPMRTETGVNLSGKTSQRCRDNVGRRKFIVYECDDTSLVFDQKAALIKCLQDKTGAKLRMIVHSGGKSLHAFFDASEDEELNWEFMSVAVRYGGDPDMYRPEQQSRLPNAFRLSKDNSTPLLDGNGNKIRQTCLYLDPR
jgi:hypothetical protein